MVTHFGSASSRIKLLWEPFLNVPWKSLRVYYASTKYGYRKQNIKKSIKMKLGFAGESKFWACAKGESCCGGNLNGFVWKRGLQKDVFSRLFQELVAKPLHSRCDTKNRRYQAWFKILTQ